MDGIGLRFETVEHGGEYPDTMPQAIKLTDSRPLVHLRADHAGRQGRGQSRIHNRHRRRQNVFLLQNFCNLCGESRRCVGGRPFDGSGDQRVIVSHCPTSSLLWLSERSVFEFLRHH
jgi:hypothetical protein